MIPRRIQGILYSIACNERVSFWLQRIQSLPCEVVSVRVDVALFVRRLMYNHYAIAHAKNTASAHMQDIDQAP